MSCIKISVTALRFLDLDFWNTNDKTQIQEWEGEFEDVLVMHLTGWYVLFLLSPSVHLLQERDIGDEPR